eukprot:1157991-Pelagomonas_calceolata.AAC.7
MLCFLSTRDVLVMASGSTFCTLQGPRKTKEFQRIAWGSDILQQIDCNRSYPSQALIHSQGAINPIFPSDCVRALGLIEVGWRRGHSQ